MDGRRNAWNRAAGVAIFDFVASVALGVEGRDIRGESLPSVFNLIVKCTSSFGSFSLQLNLGAAWYRRGARRCWDIREGVSLSLARGA